MALTANQSITESFLGKCSLRMSVRQEDNVDVQGVGGPRQGRKSLLEPFFPCKMFTHCFTMSIGHDEELTGLDTDWNIKILGRFWGPQMGSRQWEWTGYLRNPYLRFQFNTFCTAGGYLFEGAGKRAEVVLRTVLTLPSHINLPMSTQLKQLGGGILNLQWQLRVEPSMHSSCQNPRLGWHPTDKICPCLLLATGCNMSVSNTCEVCSYPWSLYVRNWWGN